MDWEYVPLEMPDLSGAMLVVGLPSGSMVGPVAASFLVDHLQMRIIGGIQGKHLPPAAVVHGGVVTSPLQMWATELACGLDGRCDRLVVLRSELPLEPAAMLPLAAMVARWAAEQRLGLVVGLEGVPQEPPASGAAATLQRGPFVASSAAGAEAMRRLGAQPLDATLVGFTAALLLRANREALPAVGLFAVLATKQPEAAAAAALLGLIDPLVPNIGLGPEELAKRAEGIEARVRSKVRAQADASRRLDDQVHRGYA